jgi:hypothetical protein
MLTIPGPSSAHEGTITRELGRHSRAEREPLTPAQRIALTIALINRGFDVLEAVVRTSIVSRTVSRSVSSPP